VNSKTLVRAAYVNFYFLNVLIQYKVTARGAATINSGNSCCCRYCQEGVFFGTGFNTAHASCSAHGVLALHAAASGVRNYVGLRSGAGCGLTAIHIAADSSAWKLIGRSDAPGECELAGAEAGPGDGDAGDAAVGKLGTAAADALVRELRGMRMKDERRRA
jgi:hypothetical protein